MPSATTYDIRHVTAYSYRSAVPFARCIIRLGLIDRPGQRVLASQLDFDPVPQERHDGVDSFGNSISRIAFHDPHAKLVIRSRSQVEVMARATGRAIDSLGRDRPSPAWDQLCELALARRELDGLQPIHFLFPSRLIPLSEDVATYVARSFPPQRQILAAANDLNQRIQRDFAYDPSATNVSTPLSEAYARRRGVCQDFSHIMISGLRSLGIPAAYVSGYLRTVPPPGQPRLEGADAMHAWVAVWCGETTGWVGFDPTNGIPAGESHVVVAIGRDYADVSPVGGVVRTSGNQGMRVAVDVVEIPPPTVQSQTQSQSAAQLQAAGQSQAQSQGERLASASIKPA